jgi:3-methyladenine DNA glycosylase AlkD
LELGHRLARDLEAELGPLGTRERAEQGKAYLKSDLRFLGLTAPVLRQATRSLRKEMKGHDRADLLATTEALWGRGVFELRSVAATILADGVARLAPDDLAFVERLIRESKTWALVDELAPRVVGPLVTTFPERATRVDEWVADPDFWVRRAALLSLLLPLRKGPGDWDRFVRYAEPLLHDREFFVRKAIGWIAREVARRDPERVAAWLRPRVRRVSGVTFREAVRRLPAEARAELEAAREEG